MRVEVSGLLLPAVRVSFAERAHEALCASVYFAKQHELLALMAGRITIGTSAGSKPLTLYGVPMLEKASNGPCRSSRCEDRSWPISAI